MELVKKIGVISLYTDMIEADDGTKREFLIIGEGSKDPSLRRDSKGNLEYGVFEKVKFFNKENAKDLYKALEYYIENTVIPPKKTPVIKQG